MLQSFYPPLAGFFLGPTQAGPPETEKGPWGPFIIVIGTYQKTYLTLALRLRPGSVWLLVSVVAERPVMLS